ncbi:class I SAM-dependent methyltransferase [Dietzia sp.]|uniref:class I SAM-dependent methyltransferase n=1 Tax=Dietzia sp. TaxID=1871616 RepID=UPI002FDAB04E
MPVGTITRGTTGFNRLRRQDRWLASRPEVRSVLAAAERPLVVDLGYGASHATTVELARWMRRIRPDVRVVGLEIDPARVLPPRDGVEFALGGFELAGLRPHLVRAANVLRQYPESEVPGVWDLLLSGLAPGGILAEGTSSESGRIGTWITADRTRGPRTLTAAWNPADPAARVPSGIAARLPKALIHRNVPGEPIHALLRDADAAWASAAHAGSFGPLHRWRLAHAALREAGWPLERLRAGLRECQFTIPWDAVAPR